MAQQAGWYRDPEGVGERWHDGRRWTGVTRLDAVTAQTTARSAAREQRRERRRRRLRPWGTAALALGAVAAAAVLVVHIDAPAHAVAVRWGLAADHRLLPAVAGPGSADYTVLKTDASGKPVTYDPCEPIEYVVNPTGAPPDYMSFIAPAVAAAQDASGLEFVYKGTTTETYEAHQHARGRAPVVITFPAVLDGSQVGRDTVGLGGSTSLSVGGLVQPHYVTGVVALLSSWFNERSAHGGRVAEQAVVMHELGHVLGLGHVDDPSQIMYPSSDGQAGYGAGDLSGLAAEGNGAC